MPATQGYAGFGTTTLLAGATGVPAWARRWSRGWPVAEGLTGKTFDTLDFRRPAGLVRTLGPRPRQGMRLDRKTVATSLSSACRHWQDQAA